MEGNGRGAVLVVPIEECCGFQAFLLDVPEHTQLESLAWEKAAAGLL
jgi:hypothetical protein